VVGGEVLADRRDEVTLATKFGITSTPTDRAMGQLQARNDAGYIRQCIDESLSRLRTDVVDLYYMHRRDTSVPIEGERRCDGGIGEGRAKCATSDCRR
jgi:aryl-alcohol dehydrogenase-like predicted oxidoreductase